MKSCLILVDLQNDYFPGGRMELVGSVAAAARAQLLLHAFRKAQWPVIHIRHLSIQPGATFFLPETEGSRINPLVAPQDDEIVVVKNFPNSFRATPLFDILKKEGLENLVICGAMSHMCIDATTRAAFDLGFNCTVAEDACATKNLLFKNKVIPAAEVHASFMAALAVPYAQIVSTQDVIARTSNEK